MALGAAAPPGEARCAGRAWVEHYAIVRLGMGCGWARRQRALDAALLGDPGQEATSSELQRPPMRSGHPFHLFPEGLHGGS